MKRRRKRRRRRRRKRRRRRREGEKKDSQIRISVCLLAELAIDFIPHSFIEDSFEDDVINLVLHVDIRKRRVIHAGINEGSNHFCKGKEIRTATNLNQGKKNKRVFYRHRTQSLPSAALCLRASGVKR
jgi:hypothetical protein